MLDTHQEAIEMQLLQDTQEWRAEHQRNNVNYSGDDTEDDPELPAAAKPSLDPMHISEPSGVAEPQPYVTQYAIMDGPIISLSEP